MSKENARKELGDRRDWDGLEALEQADEILAKNIPGLPEEVIQATNSAAGLVAFYFGNLLKAGLKRDEALHLTTVWMQTRYGAQ